MKITSILICLFVALAPKAFGQQGAFKRAAKLESQFKVEEARNIYLGLADKGNAEAFAKLGHLSLKQKNYAKAQEWLEKAADTGHSSPSFAWDMGSLYLTLDSTELATRWFLEYALLAPDDPRGEAFIEFILERPESVSDSAEMTLRLLPFNSPYADYAPSWYLDGFLFTSDRPNMDLGVEYISSTSGQPHANIYQVRQKDSVRWSRPNGLDQVFNTRFNEGTTAMSPDSQSVYFSRSSSSKGKSKGGSPRMQILRVDREGSSWGKPVEVTVSSKKASCAYPAVSPDGEYLYFASDMEGGAGGMDLYRCRIDGKEYGKPVNLGTKINSPGNEVFLYLAQDDLLYFSSDGHPGYGGLDIYYVYELQGDWKSPQNPGMPLNSTYDDFSFILRTDGDQAFLASNRFNKNRDMDIFELYVPELPFEDCAPQQEPVFCYTFFERTSLDSMPYQLLYRWDMGDGTVRNGVKVRHCFPDTGSYPVSLVGIDSVTLDTVLLESRYLVQIDLPVQARINAPDTALHKTELAFDALSTYLPKRSLRKFEWDFGDGESAVGPEVSHVYRKPGIYTLQLGIRTLNEVTGARENHCVTKSIVVLDKKTNWTPAPVPEDPLDRPFTSSEDTLGPMVGTDHPEAGPDSIIRRPPAFFPKNPTVAAENNGPKPPKEERGREKNLFSFKIKVESEELLPAGAKIVFRDLETGTVIEERFIPLGSGILELNLPKDMHIAYHTEIDGFFPVSGNIDLRQSKRDLATETVLQVSSLAALEKQGATVRLNNIFFDFDKAVLKPASYQELSRVLRFMQENPNISVEVEGHTDSIGSSAYNDRLSEKRATSVARFLVINGCGAERISVNGYGESRPFASNNTSRGQALNRRVELQFFSIQP